MKQRIDYIDLAKGICILLIIIHHLRSPLNQTDVSRMLLCFRIPLYFVLSGIFFRKYAGFVNFTLRKVNKLLIPFGFFIILTFIFYGTGLVLRGHSNLILQFPHNFVMALRADDIYLNTPLWFLLCLFETSLIFYLIYIVCDKFTIKGVSRKVLMAVICFSIGIIGYELGTHKIDLPLWIDTSMTAIPFYCTGYFLSQETDFLIPNKLDKYIPVFLVVLGVIVYFLADFIEMETNIFKESYISFYVSAMSGTLFVLLLSKLVKKVPMISLIGRYSIIVLSTHWIVLWALKKYLYFITNVWLQFTVFLVLIVLISIPLIKFFLKYFPKFVAQKNLIKVD